MMSGGEVVKQSYILALDQGTTSSRAILFDRKGKIVHIAQQEFSQIFRSRAGSSMMPRKSGSRCRASSPTYSRRRTLGRDRSPRSASRISGRRRSSGTRDSGRPIHHAIVWQIAADGGICEQLKRGRARRSFRERRGC